MAKVNEPAETGTTWCTYSKKWRLMAVTYPDGIPRNPKTGKPLPPKAAKKWCPSAFRDRPADK